MNYFLSNYHIPSAVDVRRRDSREVLKDFLSTTVVKDYNEQMNGVDKLDQHTIIMKRNKEYRWPMRFLMKSLEWSLRNAFILMEQDKKARSEALHKNNDMLQFRKDVCNAMIGQHRPSTQTNKKANEHKRLDCRIRHDPQVPETNNKRCNVCEEQFLRAKKDEKTTGVSYGLKSVKTAIQCSGYLQYLCIKKIKQKADGSYSHSSCWTKYHTMVENWRQLQSF